MKLSEHNTYGHELLVHAACRNLMARLFSAGDYQKGNEIDLAYTGTNEPRVADFVDGVSQAVDQLMGLDFSPPACNGEQAARRFLWVTNCSARVGKGSAGLLPLPYSSHLLCKCATRTDASHV